MKGFLALLSVMLVLMSPVQSYAANIPVTSCQEITTPGYYVLAANITTATYPTPSKPVDGPACISIHDVTGVTLDFTTHKFTYVGHYYAGKASGGTAVFVVNANNVTITGSSNGISGVYGDAIGVINSPNVTVRNMVRST